MPQVALDVSVEDTGTAEPCQELVVQEVVWGIEDGGILGELHLLVLVVVLSNQVGKAEADETRVQLVVENWSVC